MDFKEFIGIHTLSGVEIKQETGCYLSYGKVIFTIDGKNYEVTEDPNDGYRSYCGEIEESDEKPKYSFKPVEVFITCDSQKRNFDGFTLYDVKNGNQILEIGTNYDDTYYPCCEFDWQPEKLSANTPKKREEEISTVGWRKFIGNNK